MTLAEKATEAKRKIEKAIGDLFAALDKVDWPPAWAESGRAEAEDKTIRIIADEVTRMSRILEGATHRLWGKVQPPLRVVPKPEKVTEKE